MNFSLYNKVILILFGITAIPLFLICFYMEPSSNELTRMGGYLENDYGWNIEQEHFEQPLFNKAGSIEDYKQYYDVVVLGDSFSEDESHGWLNYFVNDTGLTVISFDMNRIPVDEVINSPIYQKQPPKLFIYESVERNIISRHSQCDADIQLDTTGYTSPYIELQPLGVSIKTISRNRKYYSIDGLDFHSTINYVKKAVARNIFDVNITEVHRFQLSRSGLFSNREDRSLLVITRDFQLKDVSAKQVEIAKCNLLSLQNKVRKNNRTNFIALVFPDKTTIYSEYLLDKSYANMSVVRKIENTPGLNIAHLVVDFKQSVRDGVVDFYLPNDTHCGYYAYKMAAHAVQNKLPSSKLTGY